VWQLGYSAVAALAGRASLEATLLPNQTWTEGCVPKAALGDTDAAHALRMLLDAMLADDPDARPRDGRQLLERLESEPAFAGLRERLDARERLRTRLEEWHPEPTDGPDEVMRCLRGIRDRLRELEAGPLDRGRPLPDSHFLTAQAAWRAARTVDAGRELVRLAFEETEASRSAYHADARVLGLAVDLALSGAVRPDPVWLARLAHEQAGVHERRGSFVRTALLRRVGDAIEERGGRGDLALEDEDVLLRARQACGDAVVAFERGVLAHFRELESRVRWAS